jgi:hypothetical protein
LISKYQNFYRTSRIKIKDLPSAQKHPALHPATQVTAAKLGKSHLKSPQVEPHSFPFLIIFNIEMNLL